MSASLAGRAPWLAEPALQRLLSVLSEGGEAARVAGGAVRDALIGRPVSDVDIATTCLPDETMRRAAAAGFRTAPTGIEHGTITVIADGRPYEVTTLRADVETDGRHAKVAFGRDWQADAERRDFTINALFADADGMVVDLVGGVADLEKRTVRFIGDADARIREDYLRILRFFRFFARFGGGRPDAEGLKACTRLKGGLGRLSVERVWAELKKLLSAPDPSRALLWMRQASVLTAVLPESEKWGIDAIHGLIRAEGDLGWTPDPLLRLEAMVPPDAGRMGALAERLKMSRQEADRLVRWADAPNLAPDMKEADLGRLLYRSDRRSLADRLRLALAGSRARGVTDDAALFAAAGQARLLGLIENWQRPVFPLRGQDLIGIGIEPGEGLGRLLGQLEAEWLAAGFAPDRDALLMRAAELVRPAD